MPSNSLGHFVPKELSAAHAPLPRTCLVGWSARSTSLMTDASGMPRILAVSLIWFRTRSVSTYPGQMALTVMFFCATSSASVCSISPGTLPSLNVCCHCFCLSPHLKSKQHCWHRQILLCLQFRQVDTWCEGKHRES